MSGSESGTDDVDPTYEDLEGNDWWWDGKSWNYWRDPDEWIPISGVAPFGLIEVDDFLPIGVRAAPSGYYRAADSRLYPSGPSLHPYDSRPG